LLEKKRIPFEYRDYRQNPLSPTEIRAVLKALGVKPADVLRKNDKAFKELGLTGTEPASRLIALMAEHPTLLQRPIGVSGNRAVLGRPPENLLELA